MRTYSRHHSQSGFTLLEVLVSVFVLSVGLLGIASLQLTSKRTNYEAVQRTNATMLAQELLERIRANASKLTIYTQAGAGRTITLTVDDAITETDCTSADCSADSLAQYDLYEFSEALRGVTEVSDAGKSTGGLVSPTVCITGPATVPGEVNVAIAWRGMTKLSNPDLDACGAVSGRYDDNGDADVYRRVLLVNSFID